MILFFTYSLALELVSTFASAAQTTTTAAESQPAYGSKLSKIASKPSSSDLAASATTSSGYMLGQPQQLSPVIYHSTVDRTTNGPIRAFSPYRGASSELVKIDASKAGSLTAPVSDLATAAGHHHGHAHGKYYEYREVPKKKTWKFGYKRGNHKHTISRHEHGKAGKHPHFKTKVKWHDKKSKGKGIHLWDYNHHDKKHGYHG